MAEILNQEGIEVLIRDNASDDGTESLVNGYLKTFRRLVRYVRHPENWGMDRNFWGVIRNVSGESDDDYYTANGINRILRVISSHPVAVTLLSSACGASRATTVPTLAP